MEASKVGGSSRRRRNTVVVSISGAAIVGVLTWFSQSCPSHAVLGQDFVELRKSDSIEATARVKTDAMLNLRVDSLTLGMKYLVCRATLQDEKEDPRMCNSLLRNFNPADMLRR